MELQVKRLHPDAVLPSRAHPNDAGLDLYVHRFTVDDDMEQQTCHTGVAVRVPDGHVGLLFARSSITERSVRLANAVGVIDAGYTGELKLVFDTRDACGFYYGTGDRCAQLVVVPIPTIELVEVDALPVSARGTGGFGSTGA